MNAKELLKDGQPSRFGRLDDAAWRNFEKVAGDLPADFKSLVSTFGLGAFGDLILFHPEHRNPMFRLPQGSKSGRDALSNSGDRILDDVLVRFPSVLGYVAPRRYLLHGAEGWVIADSEMECADAIGDDLAIFINKAFASLAARGPLTPLAKTIWKSSPDGSRVPFWTPV